MVQPVYLFDLAFQRAEWLSTRQTAVAENVANANTPNYRARDVEPFAATLNRTALAMETTSANHLPVAGSSTRDASFKHAVSTGGNDVVLEKELIKAGEVARDYALNTSIIKSFHRMWMASVKG